MPKDHSLTARTVLLTLLKRLESDVSEITVDRRSASVVELDQLMEKAGRGRGHLVKAVVDARKALTSDDPDQIIEAAFSCPAFERTGRDVQSKNLRRIGGRKRGKDQTVTADARWEPWRQRYQALLAQGFVQRVAIKKVWGEIVLCDFVTPAGDSPDIRTIRRQLRKE